MARRSNGERPGLSTATTVSLGSAIAIVLTSFGGVWWASNQSAQITYLANDVNGLRINMNAVQNELANIKKAVDRIEWATSAEATKKK